MSKLNITLEKAFPDSKVEPIMIRLGADGPEVWMSILNTSPKCIRVSFEEPDGARHFDIVKKSLIK
jgi:hypothetical protein